MEELGIGLAQAFGVIVDGSYNFLSRHLFPFRSNERNRGKSFLDPLPVFVIEVLRKIPA